MHAFARSVQHMRSGPWYYVGVVALVMVTATGPGQVITLVADCYWSTSKSSPVLHTSTQTDLVVRSALQLAKPLYLTGAWQRTVKTKTGQTWVWTDNLARGMLVRTHAWDGGEVRLVDGVLTLDGRVMVDGKALERANGPGG